MDYKAAIHKFSTKPPGYEAARQRENQRRHRARVKGQITDLEAKLHATEARLDEALRRIEELTGEVQRLQTLPSRQIRDIGPSSTTSAPQAGSCEKGCNSSASGDIDHSSERRLESPNNVTLFVTPQDLDPLNPELANATTSVANTAPIQSNGKQQDIGDDPTDDCALLPPPNPGESTMRCRDAYSMLKDRIMPEFDPELVTEWLKPGFRRAVCPGDGCRVQTHVLFAFVDHITSD